MTLRTFLLIDSIALDIAGVAALVAGQVVLGVVLLGLAALAFGAFLSRRPRLETVT